MSVIGDAKAAYEMLTGYEARLKALEAKVAELQAQLDGPIPPEACKKCGERALRLRHTMPNPSARPPVVHQSWQCSACNGEERRLVKP